MKRLLTVLAVLLLAARPAPSPTPVSPLAHHGFVTPRAVAERAIAFRPFVPAARPIDVALEPPFHGDQISANEGIAYAYRHAARTWVLSEWPIGRGSIDAFPPLAENDARCGTLHAAGGTTRPRGVVWKTPRGLVMSLLPDGSAERRVLVAEWRRLARLGACG